MAVIKFIISVLACQAAGVIGAFFTTTKIPTWYAGLNKPSFNPPNWIFGPVWTTLYLLMGISLFLLWNSREPGKRAAIIVFMVQLGLNILWSLIFFGLQSPAYAFLDIVLLWLAIVATIILSWPVSHWAAGLSIPYILWVSFAAVLNFYIWRLNS